MTNELICYKQMPVWTKDKLPKMFQEKHNTKVGTWGKLTVLKGKLKFYELPKMVMPLLSIFSRLKVIFHLLSHKPGTELKHFLMT